MSMRKSGIKLSEQMRRIHQLALRERATHFLSQLSTSCARTPPLYNLTGRSSIMQLSEMLKLISHALSLEYRRTQYAHDATEHFPKSYCMALKIFSRSISLIFSRTKLKKRVLFLVPCFCSSSSRSVSCFFTFSMHPSQSQFLLHQPEPAGWWTTPAHWVRTQTLLPSGACQAFRMVQVE